MFAYVYILHIYMCMIWSYTHVMYICICVQQLLRIYLQITHVFTYYIFIPFTHVYKLCIYSYVINICILHMHIFTCAVHVHAYTICPCWRVLAYHVCIYIVVCLHVCIFIYIMHMCIFYSYLRSFTYACAPHFGCIYVLCIPCIFAYFCILCICYKNVLNVEYNIIYRYINCVYMGI